MARCSRLSTTSFKHYGNSSVTRLATDVEWPNADSPNPYLVREYEPAVEGGDSEFTAGVLNRIWEGYGPLDAIQLSNMTHEPGTPWDRVNAENPGGIKRGTVIPIEYLESYFGERVGRRGHRVSKGKRPKLQQDIPSPTASAAVPADPRTAAELAGRRASPTDRLDAANSTLVVTLESRIDFHITECARHEAAIRELRMAIDAERETTAQLRAERERLKSRADSRGVADLLSPDRRYRSRHRRCRPGPFGGGQICPYCGRPHVGRGRAVGQSQTRLTPILTGRHLGHPATEVTQVGPVRPVVNM